MKSDVVKTKYGMVSGVSSDTEGVRLFKGIPIGADTAGANRFREPQPPECWEGVRICDAWPDRFLQETATHTPGSFWGDEFYFDPEYEPGNSEDGLYVNIYAPEMAPEEGLPVLAYIHGGGFTSGYASEMEFNASKLAAQGVIVVLLQYRLGALGWLSLPELSAESPHGVSGNWAVLDLIHGLSWIRDNIAGFGGKAKEVTIAGQSAGAMAVTCLLSTPLAKGLFRAAIVQSGFNGFLKPDGIGASFADRKEAEEKNRNALQELFGEEMTAEKLRAIPTEEFLKPRPNAGRGMDGKPMTLLAELTQAAGHMVLDGYVFTEESVKLLEDGSLDGIRILMGGTSDEATSLYGDFISHMGITPENIAEKLDCDYGAGCAAVYPTGTKEEAEFSFLRVSSDRSLQKYLITAERTEGNREHETYVYYFHQTPPGRNAGFRGAYHSSELWYMFHSLRDRKGQRDWTESDYKMADLMSAYWVNFVKNGDPNGSGLPEWEPCRKETGLKFASLGNGTAEMAEYTEYKERDLFHRRQLSVYKKE